MADKLVIVLTALPGDKDAAAVATHLVAERLAACVSVLPMMRSIYAWKGTIERAEEQQLLIKTSERCVPALERRIRELHPYEVPEFLVLPIQDGSQDYVAWLLDATTSKPE